ncbi:acyl-CoA-binding domain-containing protein 1-like [Iris pallida]|uniref:Acyl-CoA-binding domain-containing protein 1-like n=1 Tax=Iris pallida TaxID=29817 RepID=A0AAX6F7I9_IRIPA|nr:acyl-CoA-binding domain-containing protein 1-like [Iris pallida]
MLESVMGGGGGGEWQELCQAVFIGLILSFLVAKLISAVLSFREDNLTVVRHDDHQTLDSSPFSKKVEARVSEEEREAVDSEEEGELLGVDSEGDDDDDWEGVESSELEELFGAATAFVAATAADRNSAKVSTELQLQLYGFYKIATEGPCTQPQPSALKMSARAKWNAWHKLGVMPPEEAMEKYITIVSELYPSWADGSTKRHKGEGSTSSGKASQGPMGPVFSSFIHDEESDNDLKLEDIHVAAREGEADKLLKYIEDSVSVNTRDSEGRTPLHWAVDRGHFSVADMLLQRNADVNAKDNEGQTPLHYAAVCEREAIAELLVKHNADPDTKDIDGNSPGDLCSKRWPFMASMK